MTPIHDKEKKKDKDSDRSADVNQTRAAHVACSAPANSLLKILFALLVSLLQKIHMKPVKG